MTSDFTAQELKRQASLYTRLDTVMNGIALRFEYPAETTFSAEGKRAAQAFLVAGPQAAMLAPDEQIWIGYIRRVWLVAASEGAEITSDYLDEADKAFSRIDVVRAAREKLETLQAKKTRSIVETSQSIIRVAADMPRKEGAKFIADRYAETKAARARRLSWAETHESSNFGSTRAVAGLRRVYDKLWIATGDDRTRDAHMDAHRQRRKLDQAFEVGGEALFYPGDSDNASPENWINCRCQLAYQAKVRD
jgi:hypothetical protein